MRACHSIYADEKPLASLNVATMDQLSVPAEKSLCQICKTVPSSRSAAGF